MSGITEAFFSVKIDALPRDAGRETIDYGPHDKHYQDRKRRSKCKDEQPCYPLRAKASCPLFSSR